MRPDRVVCEKDRTVVSTGRSKRTPRLPMGLRGPGAAGGTGYMHMGFQTAWPREPTGYANVGVVSGAVVIVP